MKNSLSIEFPEFQPNNWSDDKLLFVEPINRSDEQEDLLLLFHQFISFYKPDLNKVWFSEIHLTFFPVYLSIFKVNIYEVLTWIKTLSFSDQFNVINVANPFITNYLFFESRAQTKFCSILESLIQSPLTEKQVLLLYSDWALNLYYLESITPDQVFQILNHLTDLL